MLILLASQNITVLTCDFNDRNRGQVGTIVTFTSMGVALVFVVMHVMAFAITRIWGWADIIIWIVTVSSPPVWYGMWNGTC